MHTPVIFDEHACNGCNLCVDVCPMDVLAPNPLKGKPPAVAYPDECWYDGACWLRCPRQALGAITVDIPLPLKVSVLRGKRP